MIGEGVSISPVWGASCIYSLLSMQYMYMQVYYHSTYSVYVVYMVVLYDLLKGCTCLSAVDPLVSCLYAYTHILQYPAHRCVI